MKPSHLAFVCKCSVEWALKKKKKPYEGYRKTFEKVLELINMQVKKNIPITTFYLLPQNIPEDHALLMDEVNAFLTEILNNPKIQKNRIKISILGKWYDLPSRIIETIKKVIDATKDNDNFFVNFCINYDGQEEIVDACKMIGRRIKLGRLDADAVTKETIKEDLYSSYFLPPDKIFVGGKKHSLTGFLLWDSVNSDIVFLNKNFPDLKVKDIETAIKK